MNIVIERAKVIPFSDLPNNSIALDGYCDGGPAIDMDRRRFNLDHHSHCLRLATKATCQQVQEALSLGLDPSDLTVYINDVDGDTVLATWLLQNPERALEKAIHKLVTVVGLIDAHGPGFPIRASGLAAAFFYGVMKPENDLKRAKEYESCNLESLMNECLRNLQEFVDAGCPEKDMPPDPTFEVTNEGNGFIVATGEGFLFKAIYDAGHTRAVAYSEIGDGLYRYTVGKKSDLVSGFPVGPANVEGTILHTLNAIEPGWGGGSSIGGGPREGSKLTPDEVFEAIQGLLSK